MHENLGWGTGQVTNSGNFKPFTRIAGNSGHKRYVLRCGFAVGRGRGGGFAVGGGRGRRGCGAVYRMGTLSRWRPWMATGFFLGWAVVGALLGAMGWRGGIGRASCRAGVCQDV